MQQNIARNQMMKGCKHDMHHTDLKLMKTISKMGNIPHTKQITEA